MGEGEKTAQNEKTEHGRLVASRRKNAKEASYSFEKTNKRFLFVFYSGENWYKMGGRSALYYNYIIAPRIGLKTRLLPDRDFYCKFSDGTVSIRDFLTLKHKLLKFGLKVHKEEEFWTIFDLGRNIVQEELSIIRDAENEKHEHLNRIVLTKKLYPGLAALARQILCDLRNKANNCQTHDRDIIVSHLVRQALDNSIDLTLISNGYNEPKPTLQVILVRNERIKACLLALVDAKALELDAVMKVGEMVVDMNTQIKKEIAKLDE